MDNSEAQKILREQLAQIGSRSHSELSPLVETERIEHCEVHGAGGRTYQVEIRFIWDEQPGNTIRVVGSVDDGGIRAYLPLTDSILIARERM